MTAGQAKMPNGYRFDDQWLSLAIRCRLITQRHRNDRGTAFCRGWLDSQIRSVRNNLSKRTVAGITTGLLREIAMIRARIVLSAVAATVALMVLTSGAPALAAGPEDSVQSFHETLISTMKDGHTLGESGRYARIEPVTHRLFDLPLMSRLAIGASWTTLSPAQQQLATAAFGAYISATYADRFDSYSGERLEVIGQQVSGSGVIVKTRIVKSNGEPVSADYAVHQNDGAWQISDVYLDRAISQLATQRSEFGTILRRDGFDGLIAALQHKAKLLAGNLASAL
jgi:phospholipid transport system substrate-binding protein